MSSQLRLTSRPRGLAALCVASFISLSAPSGRLDGQSPGAKGGIDETGPYTVVENWFQPLHAGRAQCVLGVYAETANRIYLATEVEIAASAASGPCTAGRAQPGSHSHFLLVVDGSGTVVEDWSQWSSLFGLPHSVKVNPYDPEKHVWVVNRDAHQIHQFTHNGKQLVRTWGEKGVSGDDRAHFNLPSDIAFTPDGSFFVADGYGNSRIVKFDRRGAYATAWGTNGAGPGQFDVPHGVTVDAQRRVYVADRDNRRIQIFDENGKYLDEWPDIRGIVQVTATRDGAIWALTGTTNRLLKYDTSGRLLTYWGTSNSGRPFPGSLMSPHAFSIDPDGSLYIADYRNHRVQKFVPTPGASRDRLIASPLQ